MSIAFIIELLVLIGNTIPKVAPAIKDILLMLKSEPVTDIPQAELERRVDAAIAKLTEWV